MPLWLFLIIIYIAHSYDSDENERELYDNKCKECIWMHNSQGEILTFLFGGYMCATLSVRVGKILGGWRKHVMRDFSVWESSFIWWVQVNFDHRGMKHLSTVVQNLTKLNTEQTAYVEGLIMNKYLAMVGIKLDHSRNLLLKFAFYKRKPKYFARTSKHHVILLYHIRQLLR